MGELRIPLPTQLLLWMLLMDSLDYLYLLNAVEFIFVIYILMRLWRLL